MGRARFRRNSDRVFNVELNIHQLDSIPTIHRLLFVHWRARRATPSEGRTPSQSIEPGNVIKWNKEFNFTLTVPAEPSDATILQSSPLTLQIRSERRARFIGPNFENHGLVEVDLAQVAAAGYVAKNYLVQHSLLNTTLKLSIRVSHQSGDRIFRTKSRAATSASSPHDTIDTGLDDDSAGTLPPLPIDVNHIPSDGLLDRGIPLPLDRPNVSANRPPPGPGRSTGSVFASTTGLGTSRDTDGSGNGAGFEPHENPCAELQNSFPNPDIVQSRVYEKIFQERFRDQWPAHIVASRVDAATVVNEVYAAVCAADGIGIAGTAAGGSSADAVHRAVEELPQPDKTLSLEVLIESRDGGPGKGTGGMESRPSRKASGRSPGLGIKSSSMGDLTRIAKASID